MQLVLDALIAVGVLTVSLVTLGRLDAEVAAAFSRESDAIQVLLVLLMTLPLALRRVYPTPVFFIILSAWVADRVLDYPETPAAIAVAIAFYTIGAELSRRKSLRIGGGAALFILGYPDFSYPLMVFGCLAGSVLGIAFIIPLRKQMIDFERLRFPSATAVGAILKSPGAGA